MGLFKIFKSSDSQKSSQGDNSQYNDQFEDPIGNTLKKATSLKNSGDIESAIKELEKLFSLSDPYDYNGVPMSSYLRYPMYLDSAGRHDEAWREFNKLIEIAIARSGIVELSEIYDKMRLVCYRQKKYVDSIMYCSLAGLYRLKRTNKYKNDEIKNGMPASYLDQYEATLSKGSDKLVSDIATLLDKANLPDKKQDITLLINNALQDIDTMQPNTLVKEVIGLLDTRHRKNQ